MQSTCPTSFVTRVGMGLRHVRDAKASFALHAWESMIARDGLIRTGPQALIRLPQSTTQNLPVQVNAVWQQMVLLLQSTASYLRMQLNATRQRKHLCSLVPVAIALMSSISTRHREPRN